MIELPKVMLICLLLHLPLTVAACSNVNEERLNFAIRHCISFYQDLTQSPLPEYVDRAYIDVFPKGFIVLFTNGENGLFGNRDESYAGILGCGIEASTLEVFQLLEPFHGTIFRAEGADELYSSYMRYLTNGEVTNYWFKKSLDGFSFVDKRTLTKDLINQLNFSNMDKNTDIQRKEQDTHELE